MITTFITLNEDFHGFLSLGRAGEHLVRRIQLDISYFVVSFGEGMPYLLHKRKDDAAPYPVALQRTGNILTWEITRSDNAVPGHGTAELIWYVENKIAKSILLQTRSESSLDGTPTEPPVPQATWVSEVLDAAQQINTRFEDTEQLLSTADVLPASKLADILNRGISNDPRSYINADGLLTLDHRLRSDMQTAMEPIRTAANASVKTINHTVPDSNGNIMLPVASTEEAGIVCLSDSINNNSSSVAATGAAIQKATNIQIFHVVGEIANSIDTMRGFGSATVIVFPNGLVQIDFSWSVSTAGSADRYDVGLSVDAIRALNPNIPDFIPITGGVVVEFKSAANETGVSSSNKLGGVNVARKNKWWAVGFVRDLTGDVGGWDDLHYAAGMYFTGTAYGMCTASN